MQTYCSGMQSQWDVHSIPARGPPCQSSHESQYACALSSNWRGFPFRHLTGDMESRNTCVCAGFSLLAWLLPNSEVIITPTQPITVQNFKSNQIVPPVKLFLTPKLPNQLSQLAPVASFSLIALLLQRGQMKKSGERAEELKNLLYLYLSRKSYLGPVTYRLLAGTRLWLGLFPLLGKGSNKRGRKAEQDDEVSKPAHTIASYCMCLDQIFSTSHLARIRHGTGRHPCVTLLAWEEEED